MKKLSKKWILLIFLGGFIGCVWLNNTSMFTEKADAYKTLAHRGLAQTFDISKVEWDTNTAQIIYEPEHRYLENTLESMQVAFEYGADTVELDIQSTKDNQLAVFHDYDLAMRTNGKGAIEEYTMNELKILDIGYGYTADGGKTYPFRGKGIGLMPELKEVFQMFPNKELQIDINDGRLETAQILWTYLENMTSERLNQITVYGNNEQIGYLREKSNEIRVLTGSQLKEVLLKYMLLGWTGYIPKEMHHMEIRVPLMYAKYLWGWPHKFVDRMESVHTKVVIVEGRGKWSEGFDTLESLGRIPEGYGGYVWTNRIDIISQK